MKIIFILGILFVVLVSGCVSYLNQGEVHLKTDKVEYDLDGTVKLLVKNEMKTDLVVNKNNLRLISKDSRHHLVFDEVSIDSGGAGQIDFILDYLEPGIYYFRLEGVFESNNFELISLEECGGIAGIPCPEGYICRYPPDCMDCFGECVIGDKIKCEDDSDCVAAVCCHASSCVNVNYAPDCEGVFCTEECRPDTLDCGGRCICQEGSCNAILI